jgi:hypothetical protein
MARVLEEGSGPPFLDEAACVQNADALAHLRDDSEVVADEEDARPEVASEPRDELEHLRLHGCVEPGRRLVEYEEGRVGGERHRDHDPLLHPARELVRVASHDARRIGDLHTPQHLLASLPRFSCRRAEKVVDLRHLGADPDGRVQRCARVLVDHRHLARAQGAHLGATHGDELAAGKRDRAAGHLPVARQVVHDREGRRRLAAAGLSHQPVRLASGDLEGDASKHRTIDSAHGVRDAEVVELERRCAVRRDPAHRSTTRVSPSAMRLTLTTRSAIASAGKSVGHQ